MTVEEIIAHCYDLTDKVCSRPYYIGEELTEETIGNCVRNFEALGYKVENVQVRDNKLYFDVLVPIQPYLTIPFTSVKLEE
jgi:hypothetical protein